nr:hypothetical protein [Tanacetum cinerariifolium]
MTTYLRVIRGSKTMSDTILKHDLCKLVIAEVRTAITNDGMGVPNLAKRDFKNLQITRASLMGSAFASTHFDKPIESRVKHLLGSVVRAMMSPGGSIVNPTKQSRLGIFLSKEIFEGGMIRIHNVLFMMRTAPMAKSLASHISSKGKSQSRAIKIRASVDFLLSV